MTIKRTTRMPVSRLLRRLAAALLALAGFAQSAVALARDSARDAEFNLELISAQSDFPALPPDLVVRGEWPNTCVPRFVRSTMLDWHIDVELDSADRDCTEARTPFLLRFNPSHEAGQRQMSVGVYEVRIFLTRNNGFSELVGFNLLRAGWRESDFRPESGFWWSAPTDDHAFLAGSGLSIEQQGDNLAISLLSYEAGNAVWYFGNSRATGTIADVPMVRLFGGDSPFSATGTPPQLEPALSLHLNFLSPSHASAWLTRPQPGTRSGIEIQSIELLRLPFTENSSGSAWKGQWALVDAESRQANLYDLMDLATSDSNSFSLRENGSGVELQCRFENLGGHQVPTFCSLLDGTKVLADFNKIGLDRMIGRTPEGQNTRLFRVPR